MIRAIGDDVSDILYLKLQEDRLIATSESFAPNCVIEMAPDGSPVGVAIKGYFTLKEWPFTPELITKFHLEPWDEDLKVIYQGLFNPHAGLGLSGVRVEPID